MRLVHPRIFAHSYANGEANWDIFRFESSDTEEDSTSTALPKISLGRISLSRHPHIVYTDSKDTVFAMIDVARIGFTGQIKTKSKKFTPRNSTKGLTIDSLILAGRIKRDTVALSVKKFYVQEQEGLMNIEGQGKAMLATTFAGRVRLPIEISGKLDFPKDTVPAIKVQDFKANIGDFPIVADADIRLLEEKAAIKAQLGIKDCRLNDVFHGFSKNIIPELGKIETDARLTVLADCNGEYLYKNGRLPEFTVSISLPESHIKYSDLEDIDMKLAVYANCLSDSKGRIHAAINDISLNTSGLGFSIKGGIKDALGEDPSIEIDGTLHSSLDTLSCFLPDSLGINASGTITGSIKGTALMSQLSIYNFSHANIVGNLNSDHIIVQVPSDSIDIDIKNVDITAAPEEIVSRRDSTRRFRLGGVTAKIKRGKAVYGSALHAQTNNLELSVKNSVNPDEKAGKDSTINPLSGRLNAGLIIIRDAEATSLSLSGTKNSFMMRPKKGQPKVPVLSLTSKNERITVSSGKNRAIISDAALKAKAEMNTVERRQKMKNYRDSLARMYPDIPRDSLFRHALSQRSKEAVPEWMQEEDFKKKDIDIRLDETLTQYFRDWNLDGNIKVSKGYVITPHFPLNNSLKGFDLSFTNDEVKIDSFKIASGKSELEFKGKLSGIKRAITGRRNRGVLKLDVDISSDKINANELLAAYQKGLQYQPTESTTEELSDDELMKMVASTDSLDKEDYTLSTLIVVPANLAANINLNASNAIYADLYADTITAKMVMKERCLQVTDTKAMTNMGAMSFDAFYSTKNKQNLKAGFDLSFKDITADKVINLMPAIDTIMPLIKAFNGNLNCEVAATASIDTNMNIIMPSINGILRVSGNDLSIKENDMYRDLAKKLLFKDKKEGHIEDMKLEAIIRDNTLEIFPFIVSIDRYKLALSGIQSLDMSYRYHASVIKSPLPVKVGIDVYGQDFDNIKYKVGRAKYRSEDIPVFSSVIEQTRINLLDAIQNIFERGVDAAIKQYNNQSAISNYKQQIGYIRATDMNIEELSAQEQEQVNASEEAIEN